VPARLLLHPLRLEWLCRSRPLLLDSSANRPEEPEGGAVSTDGQPIGVEHDVKLVVHVSP